MKKIKNKFVEAMTLEWRSFSAFLVSAIFAVGKSIAINHVKPVITERTILYVVLLYKRLYVDLQIKI